MTRVRIPTPAEVEARLPLDGSVPMTGPLDAPVFDRGGQVFSAGPGLPVDGTTDATPAIQAAIDAAHEAAQASGERATASIPFVPAGLYLGSFVHVKPGVLLDGNGNQFYGNRNEGGYGHYNALIYIGGLHPDDGGSEDIVEDCHVRGVRYTTNSFSGDPTGPDLLDTARYDPDHVRVGVAAFRLRGGSIEDVHVARVETAGVRLDGCEDVDVTRCRFESIRWQGVANAQARLSEGCSVTQCRFTDIGSYAVDLHSGPAGNWIEKNRIRRCVQLAKSQHGPLNIIGNVGSILDRGDALSRVAVLVEGAGSIVADNRLTGVVDFCNAAADDVTVRGNRITGGSVPPTRIVYVQGQNVTIEHNVFRYGLLGTRGIEFHPDGSGSVEENTIVCSANQNDRFPVYSANNPNLLRIIGNRVHVTNTGGSNVSAAFFSTCSDLVVKGNNLRVQSPGGGNPSLYLLNCGGVAEENAGNSQIRVQDGTVRHYDNRFSAAHINTNVHDWRIPRTNNGTPNNVLTPRYRGDMVADGSASPAKIWVAAYETITGWVALN